MFDYEIIKHIQNVSENSIKNRMELNYVRWGKYKRFDIRYWDNEYKKPGKGIALTKEESLELFKILPLAINYKINVNQSPVRYYCIDDTKIPILDVFGQLSNAGSFIAELTLIDWGYGAKIDLRKWNNTKQMCKKGVTLTKKECQTLHAALSKEHMQAELITENNDICVGNPSILSKSVSDVEKQLFL